MMPHRRCPPRPWIPTAAVLASMLCVGGAAAAQRDAAAPDAQGRPRLLWKHVLAEGSVGDLVAGNGAVFAIDRSGRVLALDAASGERRWISADKDQFSLGFGLALSAAADFDAVLVGSDKGLSALDRKTGKTIWRTDVAAGVAGPACTQTAVIAGSADGKVYACELRTGKILWQHDYLEDRPDDPPGFHGAEARFDGKAARPRGATTDGKLVALSIFDQCRTLALDAATGKRLWDFRTQGWMFGRPAIGQHNVFVGSQDDHAYAVDKDLGKPAWEVATGARVEAGATPGERFVYFGSCDGNLYCVDQVVGRVAWKLMTEHEEGQGAPIYSSPLVLGDVVYLAAMRGKVYAADRRTGKLLWDFCPSPKSELDSDLVTDGGRLYVASRKSDEGGENAVLAIDAR